MRLTGSNKCDGIFRRVRADQSGPRGAQRVHRFPVREEASGEHARDDTRYRSIDHAIRHERRQVRHGRNLEPEPELRDERGSITVGAIGSTMKRLRLALNPPAMTPTPSVRIHAATAATPVSGDEIRC